ncbi:MAG: hypothetical protein IPM54_34760 [Polyangiaceae bacterium]|nr:hypothetical protein [Polyangiaceae bacterium]
MARKVVFFLSTIAFYAAAAHGCAPELTTTPEEEPWGTGGSGGASSSSEASSSSSSSSSSGQSGSENCLDGVDNDSDVDIDCADSDCAADYTCVAALPNGWTLAIVQQGTGSSPPAGACDDGSAPDVVFTEPAGPAECTKCECGQLTGTTCAPPIIVCSTTNKACSFGKSDWTSSVASGNCVKPTSMLGGSNELSCQFTIGAEVQIPGDCSPSTVDFPNKDMFGGWVRACAVTENGGGCGPASACVPEAPANASMCIRQNGDQSCPVGWPSKVVAYEGADDNRSCSACACNASPTCSGGSYTFYDADECIDSGMDPPITVNNMACVDLSQLLDGGTWSVRANLPVPGGSCTPTGGNSTGSVTPTGAVTFCCE